MSDYIEQAISKYEVEGIVGVVSSSPKLVKKETLYRTKIYYDLIEHIQKLLISFDVDKFNSPCNPMEIKYVSPNMINNISFRNREYKFGSVIEGEWDKLTPEEAKKENDKQSSKLHEKKYPSKKFEHYHIHRSIKDHFCEDVPWEETDLYSIAIEELNQKGEYWHGCKSKEDLKKRFNFIEYLYDKIDEIGYKKQKELKKISFNKAIRNEINIDIGRDGELLFQDGRHRLSIAKVQQLEKIPVTILGRHKKWMEKRDYIYNNGFSEKYKNLQRHPDLREFS